MFPGLIRRLRRWHWVEVGLQLALLSIAVAMLVQLYRDTMQAVYELSMVVAFAVVLSIWVSQPVHLGLTSGI